MSWQKELHPFYLCNCIDAYVYIIVNVFATLQQTSYSVNQVAYKAYAASLLKKCEYVKYL